MNTTALDSIASAALGAVLVAITWLLKHESQLKGLLNLLPSIAANVETAKAAVGAGGLGQAVTTVRAELDDESRALLRGLVARLDAAAAAAAAGPTPPAGTTPAGQPTAPPAAAPGTSQPTGA